MPENRQDRRMTDPLLIEIHGMVQRMDQKMDDTMITLTSHIQSDDTRFKPVEELNNFMRIAWKIAAAVIALGGVGGLATWIKYATSHIVPQ